MNIYVYELQKVCEVHGFSSFLATLYVPFSHIEHILHLDSLSSLLFTTYCVRSRLISAQWLPMLPDFTKQCVACNKAKANSAHSKLHLVMKSEERLCASTHNRGIIPSFWFVLLCGHYNPPFHRII